jgi:PKD repeat protein
VSLSAASPSSVSYNIATADGTATAGSDYVASSLTGQTIPAGQISKNFVVTINGDTTVEPDETFFVNVSNVSGATVVRSQAVGTIQNDDVANVAPTAGFTYTTNTLTANFTDTSTDSDGTIASRSWDFGDGTTSTATNPSRTYAAAGTYPVTLTVTDNGGLSSQTTQQVTVTAPSVSLSIADAAITEGNSGTKTLIFTVSLSAASSSNVSYNIATANGTATAGSDYVASSLTNQIIPAGQTSKTFSVTINGDTTPEPDETFYVNISNVVGALVARGQAVGTIQNDDCSCLSIADVTVTEGNSGTTPAVFTISIPLPLPNDVTFNVATASGTATSGSDFIANSQTGMRIPAGQLSTTFTVQVIGDTVVEPNERFRVNLSNVQGTGVTRATAFGYITNDD